MPHDEITIRLVCKNLPGIRFVDPYHDPQVNYKPVYLGIQKNREVIETVPADCEQAVFAPVFRIGTQKNGAPNFLGPFAHGTPDQRFIYLSWGVKKPDGTLEMFRRAKIHLRHLTWRHIKIAQAANTSIMAELSLTDAKGGPLCASVKEPYIQWKL